MKEGGKFRYVYDFGDDWEHKLVVEKVVAPVPGATYPDCIAGRRACPPEDCGGVGGYADLLLAVADPEHCESALLLERAGGAFDPEAFDTNDFAYRLELVRSIN